MLLLPLVCCVPPMHQITVPGRFLAINSGNALELGARHAGDALGFLRCSTSSLPCGCDPCPRPAGRMNFLVFPAVLEDVPEDAPDHRERRCPDGCARTRPHARPCA